MNSSWLKQSSLFYLKLARENWHWPTWNVLLISKFQILEIYFSGVFNCQLQKSQSSLLTSLQLISLFGKYQSKHKALPFGFLYSCKSLSRWRFPYLFNISEVSPDVSVQVRDSLSFISMVDVFLFFSGKLQNHQLLSAKAWLETLHKISEHSCFFMVDSVVYYKWHLITQQGMGKAGLQMRAL